MPAEVIKPAKKAADEIIPESQRVSNNISGAQPGIIPIIEVKNTPKAGIELTTKDIPSTKPNNSSMPKRRLKLSTRLNTGKVCLKAECQIFICSHSQCSSSQIS